MDRIEESVTILRKENQTEKLEIISYLEELFRNENQNQIISKNTCASRNTYFTELLKYEQRINHKLTEIKYNLKKFLTLHKPPIHHQTEHVNTELDSDIVEIKDTTMKLLVKLDKFIWADEVEVSSPQTTQMVEGSVDVKYPYISKDTLDLLSDHTKLMLNDMSEEGKCGHFSQVREDFPDITKTCTAASSRESSEKLPQILQACGMESKKINSEDSYLQVFLDGTLHNSKGLDCGDDESKKELITIEAASGESSNIGYFNQSSVSSKSGTNVTIVQSNVLDLLTGDSLEMFQDALKENHENVRGESSMVQDIKENSTITEKICINEISDDRINPKISFDAMSVMSAANSASTEYYSIDEQDNIECDEIIAVKLNNGSDGSFYEYDTLTSDIGMNKISESEKSYVKDSDLDVSPVTSQKKKKKKKLKVKKDVSRTSTKVYLDKNLKNSPGFHNNLESAPNFSGGVGNHGSQPTIEETVKNCNLKANQNKPISNVEEKVKKLGLQDRKTILEQTRPLPDLQLQSAAVENIQIVDEIATNSSVGVRSEESLPTKKETAPNYRFGANQNKPISNVEGKIIKLGLQDRRTIFEESRPTAVLPDLRLQPVAKKTVQINDEIEIQDRVIPEMYVNCLFCHIESPAEFYIHLDDEESRLIDNLNDYITEHYKKTKTPFTSKLEAYKSLDRFCCAYVKEDRMYYRAEILDWLFGEKESKLLLVRLVDYGNKVIVHFKNLRKLTKELTFMPKIAVKCFLPMLYPPGSTRTNILTEWPLSSINALGQLSGLCDMEKTVYFKIFYMHQENDCYGIDLYSLEESELNTVGQLLIDLGHAVQIILPKDDPMGVTLDEEDITRMETYNNINEAVLGYDPRDEARICKFTRKDGTCFKGNNCKLEHVQYSRGGFTTDKVLTYVGALSDIAFPTEGDLIRIRFTVFLGASHYFINLLDFVDNLNDLVKALNDRTTEATFEKYKIMPAYGEVVLVKHWTKQWMRAKVRHHAFDDDGNCTGVQVFMVDYGDIIDVPLKDVRHIRPEFLELPFQAVECIMYNYKTRNDAVLVEMDTFFYENMVFRAFDARVLAVSDMLLCLSIFHKDEDLGNILVEKGFLTRTNSSCFPASQCIVIPG